MPTAFLAWFADLPPASERDEATRPEQAAPKPSTTSDAER
jgi:hypothetical protein